MELMMPKQKHDGEAYRPVRAATAWTTEDDDHHHVLSGLLCQTKMPFFTCLNIYRHWGERKPRECPGRSRDKKFVVQCSLHHVCSDLSGSYLTSIVLKVKDGFNRLSQLLGGDPGIPIGFKFKWPAEKKQVSSKQLQSDTSSLGSLRIPKRPR